MSKYLVDPFKMFPDSSHVRYYEKKWAKTFSSLKSLHLFSKIGDFNNLLGPKKVLQYVPEQLSEMPVDPYKLFLEVYHTR